MEKSFSLAAVRGDVLEYCERLRDPDGPCGAYRKDRVSRCDLYSSCDVAILRAIMGEDLIATLSAGQRGEWCGHINGFASPVDGSYRDDALRHSSLHANGMVIGALGALGGKQAWPVTLYSAFDSAEKVHPWLDSLNWTRAWPESHAFWGGIHCFSFSARATLAWRESVFAWLDANADPRTGWWRCGIPHADRNQGLGGAVHLFPLYEHHVRRFPLPACVIDSVLALQLPAGNWLDRPDIHIMHYLELDALYALAFMGKLERAYRRSDILEAVERYAGLVRRYYARHARELFTLHPHMVLAAVGVFGLLQQLLPERFVDSVPWTDIFSDRRFYRTREVECLESEVFA